MLEDGREEREKVKGGDEGGMRLTLVYWAHLTSEDFSQVPYVLIRRRKQGGITKGVYCVMVNKQ